MGLAYTYSQKKPGADQIIGSIQELNTGAVTLTFGVWIFQVSQWLLSLGRM